MSAHGPGAFNDDHDTQNTSPDEPRREHDTQDTPTRSLETRNPTRPPGGTPSGHAAAMGCPSGPGRSRVSSSSIHQPCNGDEE
jgi:hypothetical protein